MTTVTAFVQQTNEDITNVYKTYDLNAKTRCTSPTNCFYEEVQYETYPCQPNEWVFQVVSGGENHFRQPPNYKITGGVIQNYCSSINPEVCPLINGTPPYDVNWRGAPTQSVEFTFGQVSSIGPQIYDPSVGCSYSTDQFQDYADIQTFSNTFITGPEASDPTQAKFVLDTAILPEFCLQDSFDCPYDPLRPGEKIRLNRCSRFISVDREGEYCRQWSAQEPELSDEVKTAYCQQPVNAETSECACVNRTDNDIYQTLKVGVNAPDFCWYNPCANSSQYLVPSTIVPVDSCPDVCGVIVNTYNNTGANLDFSEAEIFVNCVKGIDVSGGSTGSTGSTGGSGPVFNTSEYPWYVWFLLVVGVIAVVLLIASVAVIAKKKN